MGWTLALGLIGVTLAGAHHMKYRRFRKMMMQNVTFSCLILSVVALAVKVKKHQQEKAIKKRSLMRIKDSESD